MNRDMTSKVVDEIIRYGAFGALVTAGLVAPNIVQVLGKPFTVLINNLDQRDAERRVRKEAQRVIRYMKQQGLLAGDYEHGLQVTAKARKRLEKTQFRDMKVAPPEEWDKLWRVILYDVPEDQKNARDAFGHQLLRYGCFQLQKSVWVIPFACRKDIVFMAAYFGIDTYITYFEAIYLDNARPLINRFKKKYPETKF